MSKRPHDAAAAADAQRESMVREAAYFRYQRNGCVDGRALDDWIAAEAEFGQSVQPAADAARPRRPRARPGDGH